MLHIGFTGTRQPVPNLQAIGLNQIMEDIESIFDSRKLCLHSGDCIEADQLAHALACGLGWKTHLHPPLNPTYRAFCIGDSAEPEKDYLERNRDIVDASQALLACPKTFVEPTSLRGQGTWYTINFARKRDIPILRVFPDGKLYIENPAKWIELQREAS